MSNKQHQRKAPLSSFHPQTQNVVETTCTSKQYRNEVQLKTFHMNGDSIGFNLPQTQRYRVFSLT